MIEATYTQTNSDYLQHNPTWHIQDSPWKANQILKMIKKVDLQPKTIVEIGCGAGEILNQLHMHMPTNIHFTGYEISDDALKFCAQRTKERLIFRKQSLQEIDQKFDLLLMIDVFEHVEDCYGFIKACKNKATHKMFHIPLDLSIQGLWRNKLMKNRKAIGHIHYFTKDTALATIQDCGLKIIDHFYTPGLEISKKTFKSKLALLPRKMLYKMNKDFAVKLLGGYSLMVLAK